MLRLNALVAMFAPRRFREIACLALFAASLTPAFGSAADDALSLGVFPRRGAEDTTRLFTPLAQHLATQLGREVRLDVAKDFDSFWQGVSRGRYDIVHYNQYHYVRSHKEAGYQVILKNEEFGQATIAGALVVRRDSGFDSLQDLRGKTIVFGGGRKAMQSYIVATYLLREAGLQPGDYKEHFANRPPNAIFAAYYGQAAAGGTGDKVLQLSVVTRQIDTSELTYLARSPQLPHLPWAVKGNMESTLRQRVQHVLAGLKETPDGRAVLAQAQLTALNIARDEEYDEHRRIIWEALREDYCVRNCEASRESSAASWSARPLVLGVFPRRSKLQTARMFKPLAEHLAQQLARPVVLETTKTLSEFWKGVVAQRYDIVHFNQFHYIKSHALHGYQIILKNEEVGSDTISAAIIVRKDANINTLQDLKGREIIFGGDETAMVSYVANTYLLRQAGLRANDYKTAFAINPLNACRAVLLGQVDACGGSPIIFALPSAQKSMDISQLKILAEGQPLPHVTWAVTNTMPAALRQKIQALLANLEHSSEGKEILQTARLSGLIIAQDSEYDVTRRMIDAVFEGRR